MKTVKYIKDKFEKDGFIVLRNLLTKSGKASSIIELLKKNFFVG